MRSKYKTRAEKAAEKAAALPPPLEHEEAARLELKEMAEYAAILDGADVIATRALETLNGARPGVPGALVAGVLRALVRFTLAEIPPTPPEVHTPASIAFMMVGAIERSASQMLDDAAKANPANLN